MTDTSRSAYTVHCPRFILEIVLHPRSDTQSRINLEPFRLELMRTLGTGPCADCPQTRRRQDILRQEAIVIPSMAVLGDI